MMQHKKPKATKRAINDAIFRARLRRMELPKIVQVYRRDWDCVLLADEVTRLRNLATKEET
jgi:hypothetical protein